MAPEGRQAGLELERAGVLSPCLPHPAPGVCFGCWVALSLLSRSGVLFWPRAQHLLRSTACRHSLMGQGGKWRSEAANLVCWVLLLNQEPPVLLLSLELGRSEVVVGAPYLSSQAESVGRGSHRVGAE